MSTDSAIERDPHQHQERQRQHLDRRVAVDEAADRRGNRHHHEHRDDDGGDHDLDVLRQPDRGEHRIEREDDVDDADLHDDHPEAAHRAGLAAARPALEHVARSPSTLCTTRNRPPREQHQVAARDIGAERANKRVRAGSPAR